MSTKTGGFVLDFYERLLIRRALQMMLTGAGLRREDAAILERLEQQFKDADEACPSVRSRGRAMTLKMVS